MSETQMLWLKERYELFELLGSGGEARVVRAIDHLHSRVVALKIRPVAGGDAGRDELLGEARVLLGLPSHPSLPLVREDFFESGEYVVVMDWVEGTNLARLLRDQGRPGLAVASVLAYLAETAEALTFLHTQAPPIVHGDVKPANLILTRGGRVKLVDFGLSSKLGTNRGPRGVSGLFEAPEVRAGARMSRASDVYALAATAYALLTGEPPADQVREITGVDAAQSARLIDAIRGGLDQDPARRPETPGELIERMRAGWASTLPTGVLTFCMSDIEGSTELWQGDPGLMAEALVRHDELIAGIVEAHGGRFLKAMGEGDSTVSVFTSARNAARAAIEANRSLVEEPWPQDVPLKVRFGLHTGESEQRGGVYRGKTPNLAARVRAAADGREVLLSQTTGLLVRDDLPDGYAIVDLGSHRLKGIQRPEPINAITGPSLATLAGAAECPYRGLLAFGAEDRRYFFGREEAVGEVLARIAPGLLLAVVGASGSGKSSLLGAGVLAAVTAGELAFLKSARFITPGSEPPLELGDDEGELLIVDQFEELYTQCGDGERRAAFCTALLARKGPVVIGVRADFYGEISEHRELIAAVSSNQVPVGPMSEPDLQRAIEQPARLAGLQLEPGLVDLVLRDVAGEPGTLPLMSHALRETWERRNGRTLTMQAYHDTGGVGSALAKTADAVAARTRETDRPLLRGIFLRLTEIGEDAEETRRRVRIEELVPQGASSETVRGLLERLAEARLVTLGDGGTAEVAHEVLIRRWPTLRRWLEEDRDGIRLHRRLSDAARLWDGAGRESTDLYRGTRLDAAVEWARTNSAVLNQTEREFIDTSLGESQSAGRRQLRINRRLRRALTASAGLLLAALALLVFALISRHDAVAAKNSARSEALAGDAEGQLGRDPQRALLLARAALRFAPTPAAMLAASEALDANTVRSQLPSFGIQRCADSLWMYLLDKGRDVVGNTCDGEVVFGDLASKRIIRRVRVGERSTGMHFDRTGRGLIVATGRKLVALDPRSYSTRRIFTAPFPIEWFATSAPGRVSAIASFDTVGLISRRGRLRIVAHGDANTNPIIDLEWASREDLLIETGGQNRGTGDLYAGLTLLDVVHGQRREVSVPVPRGHVAVLSLQHVSTDRRTWFITGADVSATSGVQVATIWAIDARTGRVRWIVHGPVGQEATTVQDSTDSRLVAVAYSQGAVDVLDVATGRLIVRHLGSADIANGWQQFEPDGTLVTFSSDGVFRTWSAGGSERLRLEAPAEPAVAFTPDGRDLLLVGARGELVDRQTGATVGTFPGFPVASVFNGCYFACFGVSPGLRWLTYMDPASPSPRVVELEGATGRRVGAVSVGRLDAQGVTPDGRIAVAFVNGSRLEVQLIDPHSHALRTVQPGQSSSGCAATEPSFTPDGRSMAIDDGCVSLVVWNLRSGRIVRTALLPDPANPSIAPLGGARTSSGAVLSPDGRYVLVAVQGGGLVRLDVATGHLTELAGTHTVARSLAISPDERFYAIGRQDGTVDEYDARTLQLVREHLLANPVQGLAFSPDSRELAAEDTSGVVHIWDTCDVCENAAALAALAARESVRPLTPSERATFGVSWP